MLTERSFWAGATLPISVNAAEQLMVGGADTGVLDQRYEQLSTQRIEQVEQLSAETTLWHGTGRFAFYPDEGSYRVFDNILLHRQLDPRTDNFNVVTGPQQSISLTPSRMYARSYADLYRDARRDTESPRFLSAREWAQFHSAAIIGKALLQATVDSAVPITKRRYERLRTRHGIESDFMSLRAWSSRFRIDSQSWFDTLDAGSDIPGNYGVLIGLDLPSSQHLVGELPKYLAAHEVRATTAIPLSDVTHLQVADYARESVQESLKQFDYDIPVVSLEDAEAVASRKPLVDSIGK